ncbi:MAG: aminotransferase class I/II-fold pyridoxal phosphate-dependent enzyme [Chloroflexi bacterium]|nr:MAG: aminotransferase class I/II-fold pyridoxal phosphate-dependent enzyme [Chloroflexota bacterium]MBL1196245.1 aminotransferase class I/II-fold pyridoxal phosphate-dependent enzyme [Chloroflexota bacterium]NOH13540.1 aminotransferase class I/II-fold pyridoxal phosphate-dependent enzyme [Chloroflexota bacterium]
MLDDMLDQMQSFDDSPVWKPLLDEAKAAMKQPLPLTGQGEAQTYEEFKQHVLPNPMGNGHPRFWGWVMGNGTAYGMLADMLASGLNPNMGGGDTISNYVEDQVIDWCKQMFGLPKDYSGLLVSGGSMANLVGLTVARNVMAGYDLRKEGVAIGDKPMVMYASSQTHSSNPKAVELLGLGTDALRVIPVDNQYSMDIRALEAAIAEDKANGLHPVCVVGNAATTNTATFDDLSALADICQQEGLWFHVDGAFGALVAISDELKPIVAGMEHADSLAFDLHKWGYLPFEVAGVLVRDLDELAATFASTPDYLTHMPRGLASGKSAWYGELGVQLTRGFRALKVWMSFKAHGIDKLARLIEQNVAQARYLKSLVEAHPQLEMTAPVPLNIVCFRYIADGLDDETLSKLNKELLMRLHESGVALPSYTTLNDNFSLRASITNHRSRYTDFDILVDKVVELGDEILKNEEIPS